MLADARPDTTAAHTPARDLPALAPVLVAVPAAVEDVLRSGRAATAMLSLQLRALDQDPKRREAVLDGPPVDLEAARAMLEATLGDRRSRRLQDLAEELERERAAAASIVSVAQAEAAAIVATASDERLQVLLDGIDAPRQGTPSLRVVSDADVRPVPPDTAASSTAEVVSPGTTDDLTSAAGVAAHPAAPRTIATDLDAAPQALLASPTALAAPELPASDPATVAMAQAAALAAASQLLLRPAAMPGPDMLSAAPARSFWGRWLYVDVLLPMIAVVIVLVVLLAWVG